MPSEAVIKKVAERFKKAADPDFWNASFCAAIDEGMGLDEAMDAADAVNGKGDVALSMASETISLSAQVHAPAGEPTVIGGKTFRPGEFIPRATFQTATPEERKAVLNQEHIRQDDETGEILGHFQEGQHEAEEAKDWKTSSAKTKFMGLDEAFPHRVGEYLTKHIQAEESAFIDGVTAFVDETDGSEDGWTPETKKKVYELYAVAANRTREHVTNFQNAVIGHFKKMHGERFTAERQKQFEDATDAAFDAFDEQGSQIYNEIAESIDNETMDGDVWRDEIGDLSEETRALTDAMQAELESIEEDMQAKQEEEDEADQALQDEVMNGQFEDFQNDVDDQLEGVDDEDEINRIWDETIRDYNAMLDGNGDTNPYRITLNGNGALEITHKDDLPDEHKPQKEEPKPDDKGPFEQGRLAFSAAGKPSGKGRWITIGAQPGADGKKHGGSPVYIEGGRITKGAPSLTGKHIGNLKDEAEHGTHRQQANQGKSYARAAIAKKARKAGIHPKHLHQLASEMKQHHDANTNDVKSLLQDARKMAAGLKTPIHPKQIAETGDHTSIPGFDILARNMAGKYPHILGAHGYSDQEGYDANAEQASERLLDLLKHGNPQPMPEEQAYEEALDALLSQKAGEEEVAAAAQEREPGEEDEPMRPRKKLADAEEPVPFSAASPGEPSADEIYAKYRAEYDRLFDGGAG